MKKLFAIVAVGFAAMSVQASYLYWQVIDSDEGAATASKWGGGWDKAQLYAVADGQKVGTAVAGGEASKITYDGEGGTPTQMTDVSAYGKGYSFYIELINSQNSAVVARSSAWQTYTALESANVIVTGTDLAQTHATWAGGSFVSTPEPTSALLMMLGFAGLALRRKLRKLA